jgi:hypothetical protein
MDKIDLKLSHDAKVLLAKYIADSDIVDPITSVLWWGEGLVTSPDGKESKLPPGWGVGWYEPSKIPEESIQIIEGFKFVFDQGTVSEKLNGKLLDVVDGNFVVK